MSDRIVVLSGAGISAESGLATFRGSGGLWEGYDINEVASMHGWRKDPAGVLEFYNMRRRQIAKVEPNGAHKAIAELEEQFDVRVVTQNIDDLHERAGSTHVLHLHGELTKARSVKKEDLIVDIGYNDIRYGDLAEDGAQLRPHIVWFGEMVPMIPEAADIVATADILIVIGTSLVVYPAAGLVDYAPPGSDRYIVDPNKPELYNFDNWHHIQEKGVSGMQQLKQILTSN
ncbi:NAD-dependent deacylase [Balneola sp. MJW-20]|uniref:SIR2 family NAD-dependent protein deacylase n=1 Tax=Gracilimonas aurantiaca TaxID=3234185 RepID=UPI0034679708